MEQEYHTWVLLLCKKHVHASFLCSAKPRVMPQQQDDSFHWDTGSAALLRAPRRMCSFGYQMFRNDCVTIPKYTTIRLSIPKYTTIRLSIWHPGLNKACHVATNGTPLSFADINGTVFQKFLEGSLSELLSFSLLFTDFVTMSAMKGRFEKYAPLRLRISPSHFPIRLKKNDKPVCSRRSYETDLRYTVASFQCDEGTLVMSSHVCDNIPDCGDESDEHNCNHTCTTSQVEQATSLSQYCSQMCKPPNCFCNTLFFQCRSGGCIPLDAICNGVINCNDGSDEAGCLGIHAYSPLPVISRKYENKSYIGDKVQHPQPWEAMYKCMWKPDIYIPCRTQTNICYHIEGVCMYDHTESGELAYCPDGTHLGLISACHYFNCPHSFKCRWSYCISVHKVCDGHVDCPNGDDEDACDNMTCPGLLRCSGSKQCVPPWQVCDGIVHCRGSQDDEMYCQPCPPGCVCLGLVTSCPPTPTELPDIQLKGFKAIYLETYQYNQTVLLYLDRFIGGKGILYITFTNSTMH